MLDQGKMICPQSNKEMFHSGDMDKKSKLQYGIGLRTWTDEKGNIVRKTEGMFLDNYEDGICKYRSK